MTNTTHVNKAVLPRGSPYVQFCVCTSVKLRLRSGQVVVEGSCGIVHAHGQVRREWVDKPDGTIITAEAAHASTRSLTKPAAGVDYYDVLQVSTLQVYM